jgi:hypothetical protein
MTALDTAPVVDQTTGAGDDDHVVHIACCLETRYVCGEPKPFDAPMAHSDEPVTCRPCIEGEATAPPCVLGVCPS